MRHLARFAMWSCQAVVKPIQSRGRGIASVFYKGGRFHEDHPERSTAVNYIFPASVMASTFAVTAVMIALSLGGKPDTAADFGIVHGATVALFYAFSANARSIILNSSSRLSIRAILVARLFLLAPLGGVAFYVSVHVAEVEWLLALALILRRGVEWIGELHLSEMERNGHRKLAGQHLALQILLLLLLLGWTLTDTPMPVLGLFIWGLLPLLMSLGFIRHHLTTGGRLEAAWLQMLPHVGSSAVIGITVFVFRLLILLIVGKIVAGDLYAAFAIGGVLGPIFTMGLGPSLLLHEQKTGLKHMPVWLRAVLVLVALAGLAVTAIVHLVPDLQVLAGKEMFFWQALGFSLIGGVGMVFAQKQRLRDIQHGTEDDVFAPDVLTNILIVAVIPFMYFVFGLHGLSCLYLFNAVVALVFYWLADVRRAATGMVAHLHGGEVRAVLAVLLVVPIFVNLETGLFRSASFLYDSGGVLSKLPIPLSVFGCYAGIALLGNYRQANLGLTMIFGSFVLMVLSTVAMSYSNLYEEQAKFTLMMQYILPMFGLVLGMMYEDGRQSEHLFEKAMLLVIAALMPAQLLASWAQAQLFLTPYLYLFSIYQHLQYVPVIVAGGYLIALFSLWSYRTWRMLILALAPLVGMYAAASGSMLTGGFALAGCTAFAVHRMTLDKYRGRRILEWAIFSLVLGTGTAYHFWSSWTTKFIGVEGQAGSGGAGMYTQKFVGSPFVNMQSRIESWRYYLHGILSDPSTFLLGHNVPPDRKMWPSAHNYYLDFIYNFGFIAALAIIGLVVFTVIQLYQNRQHILTPSAMSGLTIVVLFLLIPDSLLKVGMRQPYPGIITFFLWGLLLARLKSLRTTGNGYLPEALCTKT
jgi:hypothetical protein